MLFQTAGRAYPDAATATGCGCPETTLPTLLCQQPKATPSVSVPTTTWPASLVAVTNAPAIAPPSITPPTASPHIPRPTTPTPSHVCYLPHAQAIPPVEPHLHGTPRGFLDGLVEALRLLLEATLLEHFVRLVKHQEPDRPERQQAHLNGAL